MMVTRLAGEGVASTRRCDATHGHSGEPGRKSNPSDCPSYCRSLMICYGSGVVLNGNSEGWWWVCGDGGVSDDAVEEVI